MPQEYIEKIASSRANFRNVRPNFNEREQVSYVEKPFPSSGEIFVAGDRIFHKDFGIGQIQESYEGSMGLTYKVRFDKDQSLKTLVAKYAVLSRI